MQTQAARHTLKFQSLGSGECPVSLVSAFPLPIPPPHLGPTVVCPQSWLVCAARPLWPSLQATSRMVVFHSDCPLHRTKRLWLSPVSNLASRSRICLQAGSSPPDPPVEWPAPGQVTARWSLCPQVLWAKHRGLFGCVDSVLSQTRCSRVGSTNPDVTRLSKTSLGSSVCQLAFYFSAAQPAKPAHTL